MKHRACTVLAFIIITALLLFCFAGCELVREGVTGEKAEAAGSSGGSSDSDPASPDRAAFNLTGSWQGIYAGDEYLEIVFAGDGSCELQTALWTTDMYGPRYYGDYYWSGGDVVLDLYKGTLEEAPAGGQEDADARDGGSAVSDVWSDGGRDTALAALRLTFAVHGGSMAKTLGLKAAGAGVDTEGYTVVQTGAFVMMVSDGADNSGASVKYMFGTSPKDEDEGKSVSCTVPDAFTESAVRLYTKSELNVRCGPSTDKASYGMIPAGTAVDKTGFLAGGPEDWVFVLLEDDLRGGGWVNTDYLSENPV